MTQIEKFTSEMSFDKESGWDIVYLEHVLDYPKLCKSVGIVPKAGSNLYSFRLGEFEALLQPPDLKDLLTRKYGVPVLYPSPGRLDHGKFVFDEHVFQFTPNLGDHFIHGLVHSLQWYIKKPKSSEEGAQVKTYIDIEPGEALYTLWPFNHRISQKYLLNRDGLTITFAIENFDKKSIPFGFGLHPFFNLLGSKDNIWLQAPAQKHMVLQDMMPTGESENMEAFKPDISKPHALSDLFLDDVYFGMTPDKICWWEARDVGIRFTMQASKEFSHFVVYTRPDECFCMENQTCAPNAHNLYAKGLKKESNLLVVEPGEKKEMWVRYDMSYM